MPSAPTGVALTAVTSGVRSALRRSATWIPSTTTNSSSSRPASLSATPRSATGARPCSKVRKHSEPEARRVCTSSGISPSGISVATGP